MVHIHTINEKYVKNSSNNIINEFILMLAYFEIIIAVHSLLFEAMEEAENDHNLLHFTHSKQNQKPEVMYRKC